MNSANRFDRQQLKRREKAGASKIVALCHPMLFILYISLGGDIGEIFQ
jgi:hypothetical protein